MFHGETKAAAVLVFLEYGLSVFLVFKVGTNWRYSCWDKHLEGGFWRGRLANLTHRQILPGPQNSRCCRQLGWRHRLLKCDLLATSRCWTAEHPALAGKRPSWSFAERSSRAFFNIRYICNSRAISIKPFLAVSEHCRKCVRKGH